MTSLADINLRRTYRATDSVATGRIPSLFCESVPLVNPHPPIQLIIFRTLTIYILYYLSRQRVVCSWLPHQTDVFYTITIIHDNHLVTIRFLQDKTIRNQTNRRGDDSCNLGILTSYTCRYNTHLSRDLKIIN